MRIRIASFGSGRGMFNRNWGIHLWTGVAALTVFVLLPAAPSLGNVRYVGNVTPQGNDAGGGVAGSTLLIGNTASGGIFVDFSPALDNPPDFTALPLISEGGILGVTRDGVGRVEATDNSWIITDVSPIATPDLIVGDAGFGLLDLFTSAVVDVGDADPNDLFPGGLGSTVVGRAATGQGQVTINTIASRLTTGPLTVGEAGVGSIVVNFTGSLKSGTTILGDQAGSTGTVTLNNTSRWDLRRPLTVGSLGTGFVNINDQSLLQADPNASVTINPQGQVNFAGGTLRQVITSPITPIENNGVIRGNTIPGGSRGDGFIDADLNINAGGELRNAAATANDREYMLVSGAVTVAGNGNALYNAALDGLIESDGGEMEFLSLVTNNGAIVARDAIMRFQGGLQLDGLLIMGGNTSVYGNITSNSAGCSPITLACGFLNVLPPDVFSTGAQIFGDVIFTASPLAAALGEGELAAISDPANGISMTVGDNPTLLTISGELSLNSSSTILELDYSSAVPSQPGDYFPVISADSVTGTFANTQAIADGRYWDISYDSDEVFVTAGAHVTTLPGDFDFDFDVDGDDFLLWQRNPSVGSLADWEANYGNSFQPSTGQAAAVPEPSAFLLALSALAWGYRRRVN